MSDIEYWGRVAQKPRKVDEDRHPYNTGKQQQPPAAKSAPVVPEETRVRDEDLPPDEY